jgi:protein-disulfide isomerase
MIDQPQEPKPALTVVIQSWWTPALAVIMLVVGLFAGYFGGQLLHGGSDPTGAAAAALTQPAGTAQAASPTATIDPTQAAISANQMMQNLISQTTNFMGDPNASVTMIEFSDYQWPYCGRFATGAGRQIITDYVETGKVRFGYFNFAFLGDESQWAGEAAECAGDQNSYWQFHDYLFSHQNGENQGAFSKDNLKKFAADMGLDTQTFNDCLDSGKYTQLVQDQTNFGRQLGVQSTPSFLINGTGVVGARDFSTFQQIIDGFLNQ